MNDSGTERSGSRRELVNGFTDELARMIAARRDLAQLEIRHDRALVQWFLKVGGTGLVLLLIGLPVCVCAAAHALETVTTWTATTWMLTLGSGLVIPGALVAIIAWRKFRAGFCGLRNTLAELNEDLVWLSEWKESRDAEDSPQ